MIVCYLFFFLLKADVSTEMPNTCLEDVNFQRSLEIESSCSVSSDEAVSLQIQDLQEAKDLVCYTHIYIYIF